MALPYSCRLPTNEKSVPDEKYFQKHAVPLIGSSGTVCYFDPAIWHRSTINKSDAWRRSLLVYMIRPWMKQRFDIPRAMKDINLSSTSEKVLQKLGYMDQPPISYDDYYQQSKTRLGRKP